MTAKNTAKKKPLSGQIFNRMAAMAGRALAGVSYRIHVASANLWRDNYNPLRSLTIARAVSLLEEGERGAYADLQWTYRYIEMQDATLGALVERRTSAIQKLDWNIKIREDLPKGKEAIAETQKQALQAAYEKISNLTASVEAMVMASFRGFAHLEKVTDANGDVVELAPVDQWFWCREGLYGSWTMNRAAIFGLNQGEPVPLPRFIIREVTRPINRVALIAFIRKSLSQKDWDGFVETYGIPAVFVIMPDSIPADKESEYLEAAEAVTSDARGVLPGGSDIKTVDNGARANNPFKDHLAYQDEQIVMRGTGGLLTMLTQSGSGTLAGGAHSDTFEEIAKAEAAEISEIFRKQLDVDIIQRVTPGETAYAYFEIAANEETDTKAIVEDVAKLASAGFYVSPEWLAEKTGYEFLAKTQDVKPDGTIRNRLLDTRPELKKPLWMAALAKDLQPLGRALEGAMNAGDGAAMQAALKKISAEMPDFLESSELEVALGKEFVKALTEENES
jgi:phage gp29-like protein